MVRRHEKLKDSHIIEIFREEVKKRNAILEDKIQMFVKTDGGDEKRVVGSGLKVHDKVGRLFTVDQVGSWGVVLSWEDEKGHHEKKVERDDFERDYEI